MSFYFTIKVISEEIKVLSDKPITNQFSSFLLWGFFCYDLFRYVIVEIGSG